MMLWDLMCPFGSIPNSLCDTYGDGDGGRVGGYSRTTTGYYGCNALSTEKSKRRWRNTDHNKL